MVRVASRSLPAASVKDDFNGDGTSDVLLQNNASSQIIDWIIQNESYTGYNSFGDQPGWAPRGNR